MIMMTIGSRLLVAVLLLSACAARRNDSTIPSDEDDPDAVVQLRPAPPPPAAIAVVPRGRAGHIEREALERVLDAGPARFLQGLDVKAVVTRDAQAGGRPVFHGWQIAAFWPGDPRFVAVDLLPGDVVLQVNGNPMVRPDDFQAVWDGLRQASQLVIEVWRPADTGAEQFRLVYNIVDTPLQDAPN
jgi:hypothetical protein